MQVACLDRIFAVAPSVSHRGSLSVFAVVVAVRQLLCPGIRQIAPNNTRSLGSQGVLLPHCRCKLLWGGLVGLHLSSQTSADPSIQKLVTML